MRFEHPYILLSGIIVPSPDERFDRPSRGSLGRGAAALAYRRTDVQKNENQGMHCMREQGLSSLPFLADAVQGSRSPTMAGFGLVLLVVGFRY